MVIRERFSFNDAHLGIRRQKLGKPDQHAMFIEAAVMLQGALSTVSHTKGVARP
jgi:hypothetical protein